MSSTLKNHLQEVKDMLDGDPNHFDIILVLTQEELDSFTDKQKKIFCEYYHKFMTEWDKMRFSLKKQKPQHQSLFEMPLNVSAVGVAPGAIVRGEITGMTVNGVRIDYNSAKNQSKQEIDSEKEDSQEEVEQSDDEKESDDETESDKVTNYNSLNIKAVGIAPGAIVEGKITGMKVGGICISHGGVLRYL